MLTIGDTQTLENKNRFPPRLVSELCTPNPVGTVSFFERAPSMEQQELVMKFLTVLGGTSDLEATLRVAGISFVIRKIEKVQV